MAWVRFPYPVLGLAQSVEQSAVKGFEKKEPCFGKKIHTATARVAKW